jgi:hypothetical protein
MARHRLAFSKSTWLPDAAASTQVRPSSREKALTIVATRSGPTTDLLELTFQDCNLGFEHKDAPDAGEVETLAGHLDDALNEMDFISAVPPLPTIGPPRLDDSLGIEPTQERRL